MTGENIRVLLVEDNPGDARLVKGMLELEENRAFTVKHVSTLEEAMRSLAPDSETQVILLDLGLPDEAGLQTLRRIMPLAREASVVVITGLQDEELGIAAIREGAHDYLFKGQVDGDQLRRILRYALERHKMHSELRAEIERRARAQQALQLSEERYRLLSETALMGIVITDELGRVVDANAKALRMFGYDREELIGEAVETFLPERLRHSHRGHRSGYMKEPHARPMGVGMELLARRKDGTEFPVEISLGPLVTKEGVLVSSTIVDITERKRFEQTLLEKNIELEKAKKLQDEFLSNVSHELRSPLSVVYQFVSILLDGLGGHINANQREYLEIALRNTNQLKGMIDDLLEASRADTCKLTVKQLVIPVGELLKQTIRSFHATAAAKGISMQTDIPDHLLPVYADPGRICQVLTNLLDNAVKFSPSNSSISVRARILEEDPTFVCVSVADCGCGIEPEESERIFDRLYQAKNSLQTSRRGLGLGLYICKELISLHGGRIWVDTNRREGCTLSFTLPVFSIGSMIAPIVKQGTLIDSSFALVTIEVLPAKAWPSERERQRALSRIQQVIVRCMLPDLDVLLPPQNRAGLDLFWMVARTNQKGADIIVKRVREQISLCNDLKLAGVSCSVSSEILNLGAMESEWPLERQVQCVVSGLEKMLEVEPTERRSLH